MNNSYLFNELIEILKENAISYQLEFEEEQDNLKYINIPVINLKIYDRIDNLKIDYNYNISYTTDLSDIQEIITNSNYYDLAEDPKKWYLFV